MNEGKPSESGNKEVYFALILTLSILLAGGFGAYYFFAPPPAMSLDQAAELRAKEKQAVVDAEIKLFQEAKKTMKCGEGFSGAVCRLMGQSACSTALGGYFCTLEGRETGD